jgi:hypothetical protein
MLIWLSGRTPGNEQHHEPHALGSPARSGVTLSHGLLNQLQDHRLAGPAPAEVNLLQLLSSQPLPPSPIQPAHHLWRDSEVDRKIALGHAWGGMVLG